MPCAVVPVVTAELSTAPSVTPMHGVHPLAKPIPSKKPPATPRRSIHPPVLAIEKRNPDHARDMQRKHDDDQPRHHRHKSADGLDRQREDIKEKNEDGGEAP